MSIINEALKKVQHQLNNNDSLEKAKPMPEPNPPANPQASGQTPQPPLAKPSQPAPTTQPAQSIQKIQTPPVPDMSEYIPVREKPKPVEPPTILSEELLPPSQDLNKKTGSAPGKINFKKMFLTLITLILMGCSIFVAYHLYKIETIPDEKRRANARKNIVKDIPRQINKAVEAIPLPQPVKSTLMPSAQPIKPAQKEVPREGLVLNGIMSMGSRRVALINNKIYEVGESVEGKEILSITSDRVQIKDGESMKILKVQ